MPESSDERVIDQTSYAKLFREIREVGQGAHGRVLLVVHISSGDKYVLKQIPLARLPCGVTATLPEVEILCRLAHNNITRLYGAWRSHEVLNILMEYADGGTLADAIKARSALTRLFEEDTVLDWFVQIAAALAHMHSNSIIHRDLKESCPHPPNTSRPSKHLPPSQHLPPIQHLPPTQHLPPS